MAKRQITVTFLPGGQVKVNNQGNPDAKRILDELAELSAILNGDSKGYEVEQHVHDHNHSHDHTHQHAGG